MPVARYLKLYSRRNWFIVGLLPIIASYFPWLITAHVSAVAILLPVLTTTICIFNAQRRWIFFLAVSSLATLAVAMFDPTPAAEQWSALAMVWSAQAVVGFASYFQHNAPRSATQSQMRLAGRLRRQSEQLQAAIDDQATTHRTVRQFESDRRALLEHLPVHIVQKNTQGQFTFVTQSFCDLVNRSYDEVIGKTDHDLFPIEAAEKFVEDDRQVRHNRQVFDDVEQTQLPDGTQTFMQVRKAPMLDAEGHVIGVQGIFWDVTKEHAGRQELKRIESMARALINAALDAVLIVDAEGHVLEANPSSETILGYTRDAAHLHPPLGTIIQTKIDERGQRASDKSDMPPRFQRKASIADVLKSATGKRIEAKLRRSDEKWFDAEISTHPLQVDDSQGWAIFIRDISRRKKSETALRAALEAAEHANAAKSEFVANVSHELRTPLTGIIGLHELLDRSKLDEQQQNYLRLAKVSASNLLTLIDDLLDFSKIESGHVEIEKIVFPIVSCIEDATNSLAARAQSKGLELLLDFDDQLPEWLLGDPHRIKQVLLNLVGNGIKFTERGEILVRVLVVDRQASTQDSLIRIRVEIHDSGIGIPEEKRNFIFEAFRQVDSSTTRRYGGTGLGLTICRDLVTKMNGEIGITESQDAWGNVRPGSCFYFELPLQVPIQPTIEANIVSEPDVHQHVVLAANRSGWSELLDREIARLGFERTVMSIEQLVARKPAALFAAGNLTIVVADYRELNSVHQASAPVVTKWVLLSPLANEDRNAIPKWLSYANISWLSRPVRRQDLLSALSIKTPDSNASLDLDPVSDSPARSANILLVEDSPISQTVLQDMLVGMGHLVQVVDNGRDAMERCANKLFDLVLMDIQMPETDGLDATRRIRVAEQGIGRRQTIYALTAHATNSDRVLCEGAGMDGFLVKPISLDQLSKAVHQSMVGKDEHRFLESPQLSGSQPGTENSAHGSKLSAPEQAPCDEFSLERAFEDAPPWKELIQAMHGNEALLRDVLSLLASEAPRLGRAFRDSVARADFSEARRSVHTLKSNVRHVKLGRIAAYAEQLESFARDQHLALLQAQQELLSTLADAIGDWAEEQLNQSR